MATGQTQALLNSLSPGRPILRVTVDVAADDTPVAYNFSQAFSEVPTVLSVSTISTKAVAASVTAVSASSITVAGDGEAAAEVVVLLQGRI